MIGSRTGGRRADGRAGSKGRAQCGSMKTVLKALSDSGARKGLQRTIKILENQFLGLFAPFCSV